MENGDLLGGIQFYLANAILPAITATKVGILTKTLYLYHSRGDYPSVVELGNCKRKTNDEDEKQIS